MRRAITSILLLFLGLGAGGAFVRFYMTPRQGGVEAPSGASKERRILFYRNPMNPGVTSPTPMKDPMGMDYIPVYEGEEQAKETPGTIRISPEKIQKIGVKSEKAARRPLKRVIRTVGRVEPVEERVYAINSKVAGWVEKLHVNRTDQMVRRGDALLDLYSPDLVSAQEEYLLAQRGVELVKGTTYPEVKKGAEALLEAARQRLKYWDISDDQIQRLARTGAITRTMTIKSPNDGSVTEKMVVEGQKIEAGEPLFKVIDHSAVWVYGEIYEYEMPYIRLGQLAVLSPSYSPGEVYHGKIEHIYSHLGSIRYVPESGAEVRTEKVRFELPNKDHRLKLGMYLNVELSVDAAKNAIAVPDSAIIDTGTRQVVIVDRRDGTFEPREVEAGALAQGYVEIRKGIREGEWVVTSANFLVDSESSLNAALGAMKGAGGHSHGDVKGAASEEGGQSHGDVKGHGAEEKKDAHESGHEVH